MTAPIVAWKQMVDAAWTAIAPVPPPAPPRSRDQQVQHAINRARSQIGQPYAWGGGDWYGETQGQTDYGGDADKHGDFLHKGYDCSGLMQYAYGDNPASTVSRNAKNEYDNGGYKFPYAQREPGDMLFYRNPTDGIHHVALYTGKNAQGQDMMVEAEQSGTNVHEVPVRVNGELMNNVVRPIK